uniref:Uncharacterized protein n=1 Tax=Moniliophthora roreri TaxID=221103 RepID=A0A0W0FPD8_MONRR
MSRSLPQLQARSVAKQVIVVIYAESLNSRGLMVA